MRIINRFGVIAIIFQVKNRGKSVARVRSTRAAREQSARLQVVCWLATGEWINQRGPDGNKKEERVNGEKENMVLRPPSVTMPPLLVRYFGEFSVLSRFRHVSTSPSVSARCTSEKSAITLSANSWLFLLTFCRRADSEAQDVKPYPNYIKRS